MKNITKKGLKEIIELATECLSNNPDCYACDLHNEVYNTDYFIIGRYQAEEWLRENYGVFKAIDNIKEYEQDNFGEVTTDLSEPERVVNMLVYIIGEEVLSESKTLRDVWDNQLNEQNCKDIIKELNEL